ncbi:hypothetical protein C8Q78DRAFT_1147276 [Trametes maxima]|nr:hypothetical protein C8Q78DRAFT_1147276 [Trametes maxima]
MVVLRFYAPDADDRLGMENNKSGSSGVPVRVSKRRRIEKSTSTSSSEPASEPAPRTRGPRKGKKAGKLSMIMGVPMDILFEVLSRLHPSDLLNVARTSKDLRAVVLTRKTRFVWTASLRTVAPALPPCPAHLSEPRYAAMLFEKNCSFCGAQRALRVEHAVGLRFCRACYEDLMCTGAGILYHSTARGLSLRIHSVVMGMMPCSTGKEWEKAMVLENPEEHSYEHMYYAPDFVVRAENPPDVPEGAEVGDEALAPLFADCVARHKHATAMLRWEESVKVAEQEAQKAARQRRYMSVVQRLEKLEWTRADFPTGCNRDWDSLVYSTTALTDQIWNKIWPRLEKILKSERSTREAQAREQRAKERLAAILPLYEELAKGLVSTALGPDALLPNEYDARNLGSLQALARSDTEEITAETVAALEPALLDDLRSYNTNARALAAAVVNRKPWNPVELELAYFNKDKAAAELARHDALFGCDLDHCGIAVATLREIHEHWRTVHPGLPWFTPVGLLGTGITQAEVVKLGEAVLDAAGLPRDTPQHVLDRHVRQGFLRCVCGDPTLPEPAKLDWAALLKHIKASQEEYQVRAVQKRDDHDPRYVLRPIHEFEGPRCCISFDPDEMPYDTVKLPTPTVVDDLTRRKIKERLEMRPTEDAVLVCRVCKHLTATPYRRHRPQLLRLPETAEGIVYHMHGCLAHRNYRSIKGFRGGLELTFLATDISTFAIAKNGEKITEAVFPPVT